MTENELGTILVDTAVAVHRQLGPGLLESVYEIVMAYELEQREVPVQRQVPISIVYKSITSQRHFAPICSWLTK